MERNLIMTSNTDIHDKELLILFENNYNNKNSGISNTQKILSLYSGVSTPKENKQKKNRFTDSGVQQKESLNCPFKS